MAAKPHSSQNLPSIAALARVYDTNERQISRWKADKAPLLSVENMRLWFAARRFFPLRFAYMTPAEIAETQRQLDALAKQPRRTVRTHVA